MRRKIRFTPRRFRVWLEQGRGEGTGRDYEPFHQVTRADPGSRGRSHLMSGLVEGRKHHFLSDGEKLALIFSQQIPGFEDCLEQFPLGRDLHEPILKRYDVRARARFLPGTIEIAERLKIRHPKVHGEGESDNWQMTSDLVVVLKNRHERRKVVVVSVKDVMPTSSRDYEKFRIESEYWKHEGHSLLLFVKQKIPLHVRLNVLALSAWTSNSFVVSDSQLNRIQELFRDKYALLLIDCLAQIQKEFDIDSSTAKIFFWKCIWSGRIPIDLTRDLFRGSPLLRIEHKRFKAFNPIWLRASEWLA